MQNNNNNEDTVSHIEIRELDPDEFFAWMIILLERLGGECFISKQQIMATLNDMKYRGKYLAWYEELETNGLVFKVGRS